MHGANEEHVIVEKVRGRNRQRRRKKEQQLHVELVNMQGERKRGKWDEIGGR